METTPGKQAQRESRLWLVLVILATGAFALIAYVLWSAYFETQEDARKTSMSQSALIEARFDATLQRVDASLNGLLDALPMDALRTDNPLQFRARLEQQMLALQRSFPEIAGFRVVDREGWVRYLSGGNEYVNLADRPYFVAARVATDHRLVFSDVLNSRITGRPFLIAARAIRAPDGAFLGIVSAAIELSYFEKLFNGVWLGTSGALAIRRSDTHTLIFRQPAVPAEVNRPLDQTHPVYREILAGQRANVVEFPAQSDGVTRIYAYRVLENYPFYVLAGLSESDTMANWWRRAYAVGGLGSVLFVCLGVVLLWLFRAQSSLLLTTFELQRSREQLREAQRVAVIGSWDLDLRSGALHWSDELYEIFELDPRSFTGSYELFLSYVHPDDREMVDQAYRNSVAQRSAYDIEHRLLMPDGRIKYMRECGETFYAEDGTPVRSIGTAQDITHHRQMEARMQLMGSAFQYSGEAILITDAENRIVTVNPSFTRLTGYEADEALGRNPRFLSAGRTTEAEYAAMWQAINEKGFWQGEIWDRRKDGEIYPKWMSVSVIRDEAGKSRYHVAHFTDISSERAAEAKLHHIAHHDVLTGLINRFSLKSHLDQALAAAHREGTRVAVLFIDLDRFKVINDTLGHHIGDELLIEVARRLQSSVRASDVVARLGGDEFVVMLTGIENSRSVAKVAEKLVQSVGDPYVIEGHDLYTSPSIGIAIFPTDGTDGDMLMKNADAAMYHAKNAGRNNFQFFDPKMNDAALERLGIEHALRQALAREEFCLHFQPIIDMATGRVAAVEALVRWQHPEKGLLAPGRFIGIAEETGLIQPLGDWVFWAACRQLMEFRRLGLSDIRMGINISAVQMRNGNLPVLVRGAIEAMGLNPGDLVFEITESVAMEQPNETIRILDLLHGMGVRLAIDDFGTGYSSLSYLRMFPIGHLKLDRSFVMEIGQGADGSVICDATIGLAHNLGLTIVAEGVETEAQLAYLKGRGCDLIQGYLFSKPLPADDVVAFIRQCNG